MLKEQFLPSSSINNKDLLVAIFKEWDKFYKMRLLPARSFIIDSLLFMTVKILSTRPILAAYAGTKLPIWAKYTIIPIYFNKTLLPE